MRRPENKVDSQVLKEKLLHESEPRTTLSFYAYAKIGNPDLFRDHIYLHLEELNAFGRIYVAKEGINGQMSIPTRNMEALRSFFESITFMKGIRLNIAVDDDGKSFYKLKIKVRHKILADGLNDDTFDVTNKGKHLKAKEFNEITDRDDVVIIDMRNHYEAEVGHFKGAITPDVDSFREELPIVAEILKGHKDKHIVMYCTGGIRCEKASAYYKHLGYEKVYQLEGGIIEYARQVKEQGLENKFIGKNFVFDERLGERISDEVIAHCHQCGAPCDNHTNCVNEGCHLLFIQCDSCKTKYNNCCSSNCAEIIQLPEEDKRKLRKGKPKPKNIFKKGRFPMPTPQSV
jgi:UPF0176 protein